MSHHLEEGKSAVILEGLDPIPKGTFSALAASSPQNLDSPVDPLVEELQNAAWSSALAQTRLATSITTANEWGDPRPLATALSLVTTQTVNASLLSSATSARSVVVATTPAGA